jgi:cell shape-determining protein MreC
MTPIKPRRLVALGALVAGVFAFVVPTAAAAPTPEVKALQKQVKTLRSQVASLRTELNALKATVGEVSSKADAANTAATTAGQSASAAVAKTNCLVNGTALVVWSNDVYAISSSSLGVGTGMDISTPSDPVTGYVAGVNPTCVPSVFPRFPSSSFAARFADLSLGALRSPH